jgi:hypothetical protein
MSLKLAQFLALFFTALAVIPAGAHLLELPNKIGMSREQYFTVQNAYRGWALAGVVLAAAIVANGWLAMAVRDQSLPFVFAILGLLAVAGTLAVFFIWTYPANVATDNWTIVPPDWAELRAQWEYSHAANAVLLLLGFCWVALAVITVRAA